jgi:hypothetical protein
VLDHLPLENLIAKSRGRKSSQITIMRSSEIIRRLVEKALYIKRLTPDIENEINYELTRLGHISDVDYEALELLMSEMDEGRIQLVPSP